MEVTRGNVIFCMFLLLHNVKSSSASYNTKELRLEKICRGRTKVERYIHGDSSTVFSFNSSTPFTCHLELELYNRKGVYGFFVFFEEMHLSGAWPQQCGEDTVQFGRDNLIFDSFRSPKYCGVLEKAELQGNEIQFNKRIYKEEVDREMDIWINIPSSTKDSRLTLVVTPYKKTCGEADSTYIRCYKDMSTSICIKKGLFCDGRVNCPYQLGEAADENSEICDNKKRSAAPQIALLLILVILLGASAIFIYILMSKFTMCGIKPLDTARTSQDGTAIDLEMSTVNPPTSSSPLNPPPYSEVMQIPPDDPPKYCDIVTQSANIIKQ